MVMSNAMAATLTAAEITNPDTDTIIKLDHGLPTPELPLVSEPITLTVMYMRETNHGNFDDMWFLEQVVKDTGITLKIIPVEKAGWTEKMNLFPHFPTGEQHRANDRLSKTLGHHSAFLRKFFR